MIRRSLLIASIAVLLSLGAHLLGLGFAIRIELSPTLPETAGETIAVGNAFEEIADVLEKPEAPEPAPEPEQEQPIEPVPPVSKTDVPDTEVLVASENPQDTYAPDTGTAQIVASVPLAGTQSDFTPQPDITEPTAQPNTTEPVPPQSDTAAPLGTETDTADAIAPVAAHPPTSLVVPEATEPAAEVIAALPDTALPVVPVTPLSVPEVEDVAENDTSEISDVEQPEDGSESEPQALFPGLRNGFDNLRNPTQTLESPLETFQREGSLASVGGFGIQSGSAANSRGPGNSDTTNYAGRVLVHLNRTRAVHVKASGFARVFFEINPDGSLNWVEVIDSSGNEAVNRAARTQIQSAVPFPVPPNGARRQLSFLYSSR